MHAYSVTPDSLQPHGLQPAGLPCPWDSPGKITGLGSHALLQGIFPTQELNPCPLHCGWILYLLKYQEAPRVRELTPNSSKEKKKEILFLNDYMSSLVCKSVDTLDKKRCNGMTNSTGYQNLNKLK